MQASATIRNVALLGKIVQLEMAIVPVMHNATFMESAVMIFSVLQVTITNVHACVCHIII